MAKATIIVATLVAATLAVVLFLVGSNKESAKNALVEQLVNAAPMGKPHSINFASLKELPEPVEKYFRAVLTDGHDFISLARFRQVGELKVGSKSKNWWSFQASQIVSQNAVSFIWDAKINISPFLHVRVRDSLINGVGAGNVSLMSAITIAGDENKPELNSGALYRYLAEAVWYPTALLPASGVRWEPVNEDKAIAHLTKYDTSIALEFRFNDLGEITGVYIGDRFGKFGDDYIKYPWEGRFSNYLEFNGVRIPTEGEVGWHLPDGWWLFWKGRIVNAEFEYGS